MLKSKRFRGMDTVRQSLTLYKRVSLRQFRAVPSHGAQDLSPSVGFGPAYLHRQGAVLGGEL